ncbi:MAG: hypothetical protein IJ783_04365 [Kiritimatiellae bacterium]|nr:hypothetical protein [Kiritimatiellia bacterium]
MESTLDPRKFGAAGDGVSPDTAALQRALDAAPAGGAVRLAGGTFRSGTLALRPGVALEIAPDAVLEGSPDVADYRDCGFRHPEMGETTSLLYGLGCDGAEIRGGGEIRMNGPAFMDWEPSRCIPREIDPATVAPEHLEQMVCAVAKRPTQPVFFDSSRGVRVRDVTVRDAPCWTFTFSRCEDVVFERVTVDNNRRIPNCDGVHFSASRRVRVSGCTLLCGDDCVACTCITDPSKACEDILVENCRMQSRSAAIRFGHLDSTVRRATVRDVTVEKSNRAICVFAKDGGSVSDISFERVRAETKIHAGGWWGKGEPFVVCAAGSTGRIENVSLRDCAFTCENPGVVAGTGGNVRGVSLARCSFRHERGETHPWFRGKIDLQPNAPLREAPWKPGATLWIDGAADVSVS